MEKDQITTIQILKEAVEKFVAERDWQQFHSPKNLSMAIAIEAAELMEEFRFMSGQESIQHVNDHTEQVANELADIIIASLSFCNRYNIDMSTAVLQKLESHRKKYPVDKAKGSNKKYTAYQK